MTDIWACSNCHSINRQRDSVCYKCGAKQDRASGEIANVRTELAIQSRATVPYRRSILRAVLAASFILAYAVISVVVLFDSLALSVTLREQIPAILQGEVDERELARLVAPAVVPGLVKTAVAIGALLFFAAWLSRVVMNIPALGGGTPSTTPTKAFIYPLIPIWNLFKTPPMIQNALYRLDPRAGGFFMILLAWIGLVGSAIVGFILEWWANLRIETVATRARTLGDAIAVVQGAFDMVLLVDIVTTLMASFGAIILVMIIFRIESRARARDREIRTAAFAPRAEPGSVEARAGGVSREAARPAAGSGAGSGVGLAAGAVASSAGPPEPALVPGPFGFEREAPPSHVPSGPRLHLTVGDDGSMVATFEGESEPISLAELPAYATALAEADGSAVLATPSREISAGSPAEQAMAILARAGIPTTMEA